MKKQYKIQLPKGKKVTMKNVDFENGVMTVNVEIEKDDSNIWNKMIQEYGEAICGKKVQKYEPKDGDFVYVKVGYEHIAIFKKEVGEDMYVHANCNMSLSVPNIIVYDSTPLCCIGDIKEIRPATEAEKKLLIEKLAEVGKRWNPRTKSIEDVRWRTGICCLYYYINLFGDVEYNKRLEIFDPETMYSDKDVRLIGYTDDNFYNSGNYFKTREAAENVAEQIRNIFKNSKSE